MTARRSSPRTASEGVAWIALVLMFTAPVGAIVLGTSFLAERERHVDPPADAVSIPVEEAKFLDSVTIDASLTWAAGPTVKAPDWTGLVSEVAVTTGSTLRDGDRVVQIDGIWRMAAATKRPFFRTVGADSSRDEITALATVLNRHGHDVPRARWTWQTLAGLRAFAAEIGVPHAAQVDAFDPAWVLWMPSKAISVGLVGVVPGARAPAGGEDVIVGSPTLSALSMTATEGEVLPDAAAAGEWIVRLGGASIPYEAVGDADALADAKLPTAFVVAEPETAPGVVERVAAVRGWQVPVSAVHTDASGELCVFRVGSGEAEYEPVVVAAQRGAVGTARVTADLHRSDRVLVNPAEIVLERSCS